MEDRFAGSIVLMLTYGIKPTDDGAEGMIRVVNEAMCQFSKTSISGAFMVDILPIRKSPFSTRPHHLAQYPGIYVLHTHQCDMSQAGFPVRVGSVKSPGIERAYSSWYMNHMNGQKGRWYVKLLHAIAIYH